MACSVEGPIAYTLPAISPVCGTGTGTSLGNITQSGVVLQPGQSIVSHPLAEQSSLNNTIKPGTVSEVNYTPSQTSTVGTQSASINYVKDFQVSNYMRRQEIDFFSYNIRPNRRIYPFFSGVDITKIIQRPNVIEVDNNSTFLSLLPRTTASLSILNNVNPLINVTSLLSGSSNTALPFSGNLEALLISRGVPANLIPPGANNQQLQLSLENASNTAYILSQIAASVPASIQGQIDTSAEMISIGGGQAFVYFTETTSSGTTRLYISDIFNVSNTTNSLSGYSVATVIAPGNTIVGLTSGSIANIVSYQHFSGPAGSMPSVFLSKGVIGVSPLPNTSNPQIYNAAKTLISLSPDASTVDGSYVGNTITFLNGSVPGETANIISYNGASRTANVYPPIYSFSGVGPGTAVYYSIGDKRVPYEVGSSNNPDVGWYTTTSGFFGGTIYLPGPQITSQYQFMTGNKLFQITDDRYNQTSDSTTSSQYIYVSNGLTISEGQIIINGPGANTILSGGGSTGVTCTPAPALLPPVVVGGPITANAAPSNIQPNRVSCPLAQSFFVSDVEYPSGIFVPYVDIFFQSIGNLPVELQIRPLTNGFPDTVNIIPNAVAVVEAGEVNVSQFPDANNPTTYTRFTFNQPIYLLPGVDYALVLSSNDLDYSVWVAELGETVIGSNNTVSISSFSGNLFRSDNSVTYDSVLSEQLMYTIHKCCFVSQGTLVFENPIAPNWQNLQLLTTKYANTVFDAFSLQSDMVQPAGTLTSYSYRATTWSNNNIDSTFTNFVPEVMTLFPTRKIYTSAQYPITTFQVKMELTTSSADVSPMVYMNKQNILTYNMMINSAGLYPQNFLIENVGNNYTSQNTSVTISANVGQGANGGIVTLWGANGDTGTVEGIYTDSNGFGYFEDIEVTISSTDVGVSNAVVTVPGETGTSGGPAPVRYISKTVTLAPGFNAGDLQVYLTATKPVGSWIEVYYKVLNQYDPDDISKKNWVRMQEVPSSNGVYAYSIGSSQIELQYVPSFTSNTITYSTSTATYNDFSQFKIKIVLASNDTVLTKIPFVYNMRAIALPGTI